MANIARIAVDFTANTSDFLTGTKVIGNSIKMIASVAGRLSSTFLSVFGKIAKGIFSLVGAFTVLLQEELQAVDIQGKLSDELGIPTEKLAAYELAAALAGSTLKQLDKGLQIFLRRLGEARRRTGEAVQGFRLLGLNVQFLSSLRPHEAFERTATAIAKLSNVTARAAALYFIFSRQGQDLTNAILNIGDVKALEGVQEFVDKMGFSMKRLDTKVFEEFNDQIVKMKFAFRGVVRTLGVRLVPILSGALNDFMVWLVNFDLKAQIDGWVDSFGRFAVAFLDDFAIPIITAIKTITQAISLMVKGIAAIANAASPALRATKIAAIEVAREAELTKLPGPATLIAKELTLSKEAYEDYFNATVATTKMVNKAFDAAVKRAKEPTDLEKLGDLDLTAVTDPIDFAVNKFTAWSKALKTGENGVVSLGQAMQNQVTTWRQWSEMNAQLALDTAATQRAVAAFQDIMTTLDEKAQGLRESLRTPFETARDEAAQLFILFNNGKLTTEEMVRGLSTVGTDAISAANKFDALNSSVSKFNDTGAITGSISSKMIGGGALRVQALEKRRVERIGKGGGEGTPMFMQQLRNFMPTLIASGQQSLRTGFVIDRGIQDQLIALNQIAENTQKTANEGVPARA